MLAAWSISTGGRSVFVSLAAAGAESGDAWARFLTDLGGRGLACPLLVVSDGGRAAEQPFALRQMIQAPIRTSSRASRHCAGPVRG